MNQDEIENRLKRLTPEEREAFALLDKHVDLLANKILGVVNDYFASIRAEKLDKIDLMILSLAKGYGYLLTRTDARKICQAEIEIACLAIGMQAREVFCAVRHKNAASSASHKDH